MTFVFVCKHCCGLDMFVSKLGYGTTYLIKHCHAVYILAKAHVLLILEYELLLKFWL
jgi:hypothetical protein